MVFPLLAGGDPAAFHSMYIPRSKRKGDGPFEPSPHLLLTSHFLLPTSNLSLLASYFLPLHAALTETSF